MSNLLRLSNIILCLLIVHALPSQARAIHTNVLEPETSCPWKTCQEQPFDAESHRGCLEFSIAENHLTDKFIFASLKKLPQLPVNLKYDYCYGNKNTRDSFGHFWSKISDIKGISHENIVLTSGATASLDILISKLVPKNHGIIVPSPYYFKFPRIIKRTGAVMISTPPVRTSEQLVEAVRQAYANSSAALLISAILLTNPNNPTGLVVEDKHLRELITFAQRNNLQVISDEINAGLVVPDRRRVSSVVSRNICPQYFLSNVHAVVGLSKLGMAGIQFGALMSYNEEVLDFARKSACFAPISTSSEHLVEKLLSNRSFVHSFLEKQQQKLAKSVGILTTNLIREGIQFVEFQSGPCVLLDFTSLFGPESVPFDEVRLVEGILRGARVRLSPGHVSGLEELGYVRFAFTSYEDLSAISVAVKRLAIFLLDNHPLAFAKSFETRLNRIWKREDESVFGMLMRDDDFTDRPISLRHPFIFYLGHMPAFGWNQMRSVLPSLPAFNAKYDALFARGIDPDVETGEVHDHSCEKNYSNWPTIKSIQVYRDEMRRRTIEAIVPILELGSRNSSNVLAHRGRIFSTLEEHSAVHHETLMYMFQEYDFEKKLQPYDAEVEENNTANLEDYHNDFVTISGGAVKLGYKFDEIPFGWDIEFPQQRVVVPTFRMSRYPITNMEYFEFLLAHGYDEESVWTEDDWNWRQRDNITRPRNWICSEPVEKHSDCKFKTMFDIVPFEDTLLWPAMVSHAEASAFARWKGCRLPTEAEWVRAALTSPVSKYQREYPWGIDPPVAGVHGNFDMKYWQTTNVNSYPEGNSGWGIADMMGNLWEWTSSELAPFPGFEAYMPDYPGYSADFFDGKHFTMKGASWATDIRTIRGGFRDWFQAHYPFVFTKFRLVLDVDRGYEPQPIDQDIRTVQIMFNGAQSASEEEKTDDTRRELLRHVLDGLSQEPKRISSLYFYDDAGSELYTKITQLPEYYPTNAEIDVLTQLKTTIVQSAVEHMAQGTNCINVIELGAGDGTKTPILLRELLQQHVSFVYIPIDISNQALLALAQKLQHEFGVENVRFSDDLEEGCKHHSDDGQQILQVNLMEGDNIYALSYLTKHSPNTNWVNFLGSSIGNFDWPGSNAFINDLARVLNDGDLLLLGLDVKKDLATMQLAYDDTSGVTREFNLNLLRRLNRDVNANFDPDTFMHHAFYNPRVGAMESWLISKIGQTVTIGESKFKFMPWEGIHLEVSLKYTMEMIERLAKDNGFELMQNFQTQELWFVDSLWKKKAN